VKSATKKEGAPSPLNQIKFSVIYTALYHCGNRVERNVDVGSDIEDPSHAAAPSAAPVGAVGAQCASRGGPDLGDQTDKVIGNAQYDSRKSEARLAAAFSVDRHGLADMVAETVIEIVVHRLAETPFQKVVFKPANCSIAI